MADKTLRIGIDSTQAEAGAKRVVAAMKEIQREAAKTVGINVPIKIDTTGIAAAMAEVNKALRDISGTSADVKIPVGFDTSKLDSETADLVRRIKAEVDRNTANGIPVETSLKVTTDAAEAEINRVMSQSVDGIEVPVSVDADRAKAEIDALTRQINATAPEIKVDVDLSDVAKDVGQAADALDDVADASDALSKDAKNAAQSIGAIEAAAKKASQAADDMGDAFKDATREMEAMELVGEALLAIATSMVTTITAFEDYSDAVRAATGDTESAAVAMEMLETFATNSAFTLEDVTNAFVRFRSAGLEASKESLSSYGNVAAGLNVTLEELADAVGQAAEGNFSKLNDTQLKAVESGDKVTFTYQGVSTQVKNTGKDVAAFIKTMGDTTFAGSMEDAMGGVTGAFTAMSNAWGELVEDMGEGGLSSGLENFARSMVDASEKADELARILGGWLGDQATLLGKDIEGLVDQLNDLVALFKDVTDAINSIPTLSGIFDSDFMRRAVPALYAEGSTPTQDEQGPPTDPTRTSTKAYGSDTNLPRRPTRASKSPAQRQQESFDKEFAANDEMIRTLGHIDKAYARGRDSVLRWRDAVDETSDRISLASKVGEKNADVLFDQRVAMRNLKEEIAFKGEMLDQSEAIAQTDELADAYLQGSAAVQQAEVRQKAYNTAVSLGKGHVPEYVDQLYKLADAAAMANARLSMSKDIAGMDEAINQTRMMNDAIRQGRAAEQDATLFAEARAMAVQGGYENDIIAVRAIEDKIKALREEQSQQELLRNVADRDDEIQGIIDITVAYQQGGDAVREAAAAVEAKNIASAAGRAGDQEWIAILQGQIILQTQLNDKLREQEILREGSLDLEQGYAEIENLRLVGEEYAIASERLDMLMQKKRETGDVTATLTAEEDALAVSLGKLGHATTIANDGLSQYMRDLMDTEKMMRSVVHGGLMSFEDALVDIVTGAKSAREAFADMAKAIAADLARMAIRMAIIRPLMMMFGGGLAGGAGMATGAPMSLIAHTGGIIGADKLPVRPFDGLPRYHNGGLASNEVPAVLQKGEGVFTKEQMKSMAPVNNNSSSSPVSIVVNVQQSQGGDPGAANQQGQVIAKQVEMAMQEFVLKQQKNGGMLNQNGGY